MGNFLKAVVVGVVSYLGIFVVALLTPVLFLLMAWTGICLSLAVLFFIFWLLVSHQPGVLHASLYLLLWGCPPCLAASIVGYFHGISKAPKAARAEDVTSEAKTR